MLNLIKLALNRLWPAEPLLVEQSEDASSMADLVRLLEADESEQEPTSAINGEDAQA